MSPRKSSSQELSKEMILSEARTQFVEKNYHEVSMRSIAKQLGCSHGALYYHFNNKAELFYAIIEEYFITLNKLIDDIVNSSGNNRTKLQSLFLGFIEFGLNNQSQYEMMFMYRNTEVNALSQEIANLSYQKFALSVQFLTMNELLIRDIYSAFIALHGFVAHYRGNVCSFEETKDAAHFHIDFIINALGRIN
ncbi:TetR/AcrR family transcriptional regulator [Neobacillus sp.]|uniref:TetR/AcrR family transcriptional regulator n=1 Tax=Neobacillus sp. TaxID=2675273 RepID=UPI00289C3BD2|nr:TetR/AcrR family transcriptional regulator [Neobacillus sp.]